MTCNKGTIRYKLKEFGIELRKHRYNAKYELNVHYFDDIDNEHKAYWIGFLLADGHVNKDIVNISLQKQDGYILHHFLDDLNCDMTVKYDDDYVYIFIGSRDLSKRLIEIGFNHRKSYSIDFDKILSNIPNNLIHHFVRGMFDGDGCVKRYEYPYLNKPQYHLGYTGLLNVCKYVDKTLKFTSRFIKEGEYTYTVVTRHPRIINEAYDFMYDNATIYMKRKKQIFDDIKMETFNDYNKRA